MNVHETWTKLDSARSSALCRKRAHAELVIPSLLPPEGKSQEQALTIPYSSLAAEGTSSLAAKMAAVVLPMTGQKIYEYIPERALDLTGEDVESVAELRSGLSRLEDRVMEELSPTNIRSSLFLAYKHLISIGDVLLEADTGLHWKLYRADQFVVRWKTDDFWSLLIIRKMIDPTLYPELESAAGGAKAQTNNSAHISLEPLYVYVTQNEDGSVEWSEEFRGVKTSSGKYPVSAWMPMRWNHVAGEDMGTSHVEEAFGDIRALDALQRSLIDGALLNAEYRWGVNPVGLTELQDFLDSDNGDFVPAVPGEVFPLQFQNAAQVQATLQAVVSREAILGRRFLMQSASQPRGERVTAFQISKLSEELEGTLGGPLSSTARDFQIPVIRWTTYVLSLRAGMPDELKALLQEESILRIRVRAGLEILHREAEREKIDQAIQRISGLPPEGQRAFVWPAIAADWWRSMGLDSAGRVKTVQQLAQEDAAQAQQQQAQAQQQLAMQTAATSAQAAVNQPQGQ